MHSESRFMRQGGYLYEGAVELWSVQGGVDPSNPMAAGALGAVSRSTRRRIGLGWTEAVGWDRNAIRSIVSTALRQPDPSQQAVDLLSSRAPRSKPPPK